MIIANAHPESKSIPGPHSSIHHPPPDHTKEPDADSKKPIPDTGWHGPTADGPGATPSARGGDYEHDWMHKPPYWWVSEGGLFTVEYTSECWCGNVAFEFHGEPVDAKHCHCRQCQRLHGAPFQWAVIFPKTSVRLLRNENDSLHCFSTQTRKAAHNVPCKVSCNTCRSPLFDEGRRTVLAYPSSFRFKPAKSRNHDQDVTQDIKGRHDPQHSDVHDPGYYQQVPLHFQPTCHIFYGQRVMEVPDGVPKWRGHKGESELMQEMSDVQGIMPRYKGHAQTKDEEPTQEDNLD